MRFNNALVNSESKINILNTYSIYKQTNFTVLYAFKAFFILLLHAVRHSSFFFLVYFCNFKVIVIFLIKIIQNFDYIFDIS